MNRRTALQRYFSGVCFKPQSKTVDLTVALQHTRHVEFLAPPQLISVTNGTP